MLPWYNTGMSTHDVDGLNSGYARALLDEYLENPEAVPSEWRALFESGDSELVATHPGIARLLEQLPHVGSVVTGDDVERVSRLLSMLAAALDARSRLFSDLNASTIGEYRLLSGDTGLPRIVLLGRLCLYGPAAARLHEELIPVTARWVERATTTRRSCADPRMPLRRRRVRGFQGARRPSSC